MQYQTTLIKGTPIAITIGNFDGLHRGHQQLLGILRDVAQERGCTPVFVTFSPHTLAVVRPQLELKTLTTLQEKLQLLRCYGQIDDYLVIEFTPEVVQMSAGDFLDRISEDFPIKAIVVGSNFNLGKNRMGDLAFLETYGRERDILIRSIPLTEEAQDRISSTRIRALVQAGRIEEANMLLGYPLRLSGVVVHGDKRGRVLGFPTANLRPEADRLLLADGIYVVRVSLAGASDSPDSPSVYNGVTSIGVRPTFNLKERLVETYLLDVDLDLYDREITIQFLARLRGEERFATVEALLVQMHKDVQHARQILATDRRA